MKNKFVFWISLLGCLVYFFIIHEVFFIERKIEVIFCLISCIALLSSFYFLKKKKINKMIISMILYMLSFSTFIFLFPIFIRAKMRTSLIFIISLLFIVYLISLFVYFFHFINQLYQEEKEKQNYIQQIEKEINNHYIHSLRHDYNQKLYQIAHYIKINQTQEALTYLQDLMKTSYYQSSLTISSFASLNQMFQLQLDKYHQDDITLQYYLCHIDDC